MKYRNGRLLVLSVLSLALTACVGGGSSSSSSSTAAAVDASGIWSGTLTDNAGSPPTTSLIGVIAPSGQSFFVDTATGTEYILPNLQGNANYSGTATAFAGPGLVFPNGQNVANYSTSGTTNPQVSINGSYSGTGDSGTYSLAFNPLYNQAVTLATIAGPYTGTYYNGTAGSYSISVTISNSGAITGSDAFGCALTGQANVITTGKDLFSISLDSTGSGSSGFVCAGRLTGFAFEQPGTGSLPLLQVGVSNGTTFGAVAQLQHN
ncbi:MAG TPA: hypothetical protein VMV40_08735 [Acidiferrobacter sp.]|nr:hypothetical protein [Acidiferrobacter sp.]